MSQAAVLLSSSGPNIRSSHSYVLQTAKEEIVIVAHLVWGNTITPTGIITQTWWLATLWWTAESESNKWKIRGTTRTWEKHRIETACINKKPSNNLWRKKGNLASDQSAWYKSGQWETTRAGAEQRPPLLHYPSMTAQSQQLLMTAKRIMNLYTIVVVQKCKCHLVLLGTHRSLQIGMAQLLGQSLQSIKQRLLCFSTDCVTGQRFLRTTERRHAVWQLCKEPHKTERGSLMRGNSPNSEIYCTRK